MHTRRILINAIMSISQVIVISIVLFFLYRFLLKTIGIEKLGIWSLILATTSVTQIANMGLSGSVVKFVAKYSAKGEPDNASKVIQTATLSIAISIGIILLALYPALKLILGLIIVPESLSLACEILPFSLFALWILTIANIFNAGLDGCQRIYIRNVLLMVGFLLYFFLALVLTPRYGLIGLAYAQVAQNSFIFFCSWFFIKRFIASLPVIPYQWDRNTFKEIICYGIHFNMISITIMLCDPITKALLSKFSSLSMVGYYEMANKMVLQFRSLLLSVNQVLVPEIANLQERLPEKIKSVYIASYRLFFYLSVPLFSLLIVSTPAISDLWIGGVKQYFVIFATLLLIGRFFNTLEGPAYFVNLGSGRIAWNVISHLIKTGLNLGLGAFLGLLFGGTGVVVGWVMSLIIGSCIIFFSYHIKNKISLMELLPKASRLILIMCLVIVTASFLIQNGLNQLYNLSLLNYIIIIFFSIIIFILLWLHPMRRCLIGWINNDLLNNKKVKA